MDDPTPEIFTGTDQEDVMVPSLDIAAAESQHAPVMPDPLLHPSG